MRTVLPMDDLTATCTFTTWEEDPAFGPDAPLPRLAQATVAFTYTGGFEATSEARFALHYGPDGTGTSQGFEMVRGTRAGEEGTFVLHHADEFGSDGVNSTWTVVEGSGTGAFAGLAGSGTAHLGHGTSEWGWALS